MNKPFRIAMYVVVPLVLTGGTTACRKVNTVDRHPEYSFGFYNDTPLQISEARADWEVNGKAHTDGGGIMNPGIEALLHDEPRPIPPELVVSWTSADGSNHRQPVEVAKLIADPEKFYGVVYLKIEANGSVQVVPLTYEERDRLAIAHKPYP
jgi:hypothetical protein